MNYSTLDFSVSDRSFPFSLQMSPRLLTRKLSIVRRAVDTIKNQTGHVSTKAVADYLGVEIEEYNHILQDANFYCLFNHKQEVA